MASYTSIKRRAKIDHETILQSAALDEYAIYLGFVDWRDYCAIAGMEGYALHVRIEKQVVADEQTRCARAVLANAGLAPPDSPAPCNATQYCVEVTRVPFNPRPRLVTI